MAHVRKHPWKITAGTSTNPLFEKGNTGVKTLQIGIKSDVTPARFVSGLSHNLICFIHESVIHLVRHETCDDVNPNLQNIYMATLRSTAKVVKLLVGYIRCCQVALWLVSSGQLYVFSELYERLDVLL